MDKCLIALLSLVLAGCGTVPAGPLQDGGIWIKNDISEAQAEADGRDCRQEAVDRVANSGQADEAWSMLDEAAVRDAVYPMVLRAYTACVTARGYQWTNKREARTSRDRVFTSFAQRLD